MFSRFIYPGIVSLFIATLYFPMGAGQFLASTLTHKQQITILFSNFTWMSDHLTVDQAAIVAHWNNPYCGILVNLSIYVVTTVGYVDLNYRRGLYCINLHFLFLVFLSSFGVDASRAVRQSYSDL